MEEARRIRKRVSYREFQELARWFEEKDRSTEEFLRKLHAVINDRNGFHSETLSYYALESIELLLRDLRRGFATCSMN